jgi:surface antigen
VAGVTALCGPAADYRCTTAGYNGQGDGWWGARYAGAASSNQYGRHNCTLYAAYRVAKNGMPDPGWNDNANAWDTRAYAAGTRVDQLAAVGAVAQWNGGQAGHVAYVERVSDTAIEVTDDNFGLNTTDRWRIARSSPAWPDNFIHFRDIVTPMAEHRWFLSNYKQASPPDVNSFLWGRIGDVAIAGNWDGVGGDTVGIFRSGTWFLSNYNQAAPPHVTTFTFGAPGDIPVVGDWNGDGIDTVGVFRAGTWYLSNYNRTSPPNVIKFSWGRSTDIPLAGNWDGVRGDTPGLFRAGTWYLSNYNQANPPGLSAFVWGRPTDTPVTGNWDGVGGDTPGIHRGASWYLSNYNRSSPPGVTPFTWGRASDAAISGDWDGVRGETPGIGR